MSHHSGDSVHDDDSDSSDSDGSKLSSVSEHGEDNQSMIGVKFSKMFVDDSGERSSFTGKVMSRTKVGGCTRYGGLIRRVEKKNKIRKRSKDVVSYTSRTRDEKFWDNNKN